MRVLRIATASVASAAMLAVACSNGPASAPATRVRVVDTVGVSEGELNLLVFAGYAEDGSSDPEYDWVHPFERETGCDVHV
ncbi:MAG TPA: spermidine/putrescine ABC transporter substrate-binding protein, partial [Actinomycetota bacterium]|nr:spermidine/putrescine ABC transporter substrate-binding protein [Actinomycetota bacterium]